jgi:peptidoglycan-associated lipoprotein
MKPSSPIRTTLLLAAVAMLSAGCRTKPNAGDAAFDDTLNPQDQFAWAGDAPLGGGSFSDPSLYEPVATPAGVYPVYFRYNESAIPDGELSKVDAVAAALQQAPQLVVLVEGNCDERGTNEYNMSLGEFRAQAVRERLLAAGIDAARVQTVSYGEEKPAAYGHDEASWAQNRRGEFGFYKAR